MYATVFNPGDSPVVTSTLGAVLGGGEWGTVQTTDDAAQAALDGDQLVKVRQVEGEVREDLSKGARRAMDRTDVLAARAEQVEPLDKPALVKLAKQVGALEKNAEDEPLRDDLERELIEGDYDLPKPKQSSAPKTTPAK